MLCFKGVAEAGLKKNHCGKNHACFIFVVLVLGMVSVSGIVICCDALCMKEGGYIITIP